MVVEIAFVSSSAPRSPVRGIVNRSENIPDESLSDILPHRKEEAYLRQKPSGEIDAC